MPVPTGRSLLVQHMHLGPKGNVRTFNESALPTGAGVGQVFEHQGRFYRLAKFNNGAGDVATIDGGVMYWHTKLTAATPYVVTADASDGEALANGVAGGSHAVITDGNYMFVQCGGDQAAVQVAASTVASDQMSGHASTDNILTRTAAATASVNVCVAIALSTRGTTTTDEGASLANSSKVRWMLGALI